MTSRPLPPQQLAPDLADYAGLWVAIDGGRVVDAHRVPDRLLARLRDQGITDVTVMPLPAANAKELVGLG